MERDPDLAGRDVTRRGSVSSDASAEWSAEIEAVERAIGVLANTMRLYVEAHMRFGSLFDVDREEAVNNLDRAFEAKLNAFHSLYDVSKSLFPYFAHGETALLITVRNALHHRNNPLFQSFLSRLYLEDSSKRLRGATFLVSRHPTRHGPPLRMTHPVRLDDLDARLDPVRDSPYLDAFVKGVKAAERQHLIEQDLAVGLIRAEAAKERYPEGQVYLDLMPVFVAAVSRVFKALKSAGVSFKGNDAQVYATPFTCEIEVDLQAPTFTVVNFGA